MTYIPTLMIPRWVRTLDKSKCIPGRIYNIYKCRICILHHKADVNRKGRKTNKIVKGINNSFTRCACSKRLPFFMKYKLCPCCGGDIYGKRITDGMCSDCSKNPIYNDYVYKDTTKPKIEPIPELFKFYRMGKMIESIKNLAKENKSDCKNRGKCLESTFIIGGSSVKLGCTDCNHYIKFVI